MRAVLVGRSQTVHVVSTEEVTMRFGEGLHQEKDVRGAGGDIDDLDCSAERKEVVHLSQTRSEGSRLLSGLLT